MLPFPQVINKTVDFGIGIQSIIFNKAYVLQYTMPFYFIVDIFSTRIPVLLDSYENLIRPLPNVVWAAVFTMIFVQTFIFMAIHAIYARIDAMRSHDGEEKLTVHVSSKFDFAIKTFSTLTEPDGISWFPRWSAGKFDLTYYMLYNKIIPCYSFKNLYLRCLSDSEDPLQVGAGPWAYQTIPMTPSHR